MPRAKTLGEGEVLAVISRRGGTATHKEIAGDLEAPLRTVARRLVELDASGETIGYGSGRVAIGHTDALPIPEEGREVVLALRSNGIEAHLTGFDPIANRAQQFIFEFPHLVYTEPYAFDAAEAALAESGFVVVPARRASEVKAPSQSRIVLLRVQPEAERRYDVAGNLASREKAWVDLLRETTNGQMKFDQGELRQLLSALIRSGASAESLERYARRLGYAKYLDAFASGDFKSWAQRIRESGGRA